MPRNPAGSYSLPAGNPVTTGTVISSTVQNNTLADIASEMTSSLDRTGRGSMSGPLKVADGTSMAPAITFNAETSSGIYRAGTSDVGLSVATTVAQHWEPTGTTMPVGAEITQSQTDTNALQITGNGTAAAVVVTGGSGGGSAIVVTAAGTNGRGITITATGNESALNVTGGSNAGPAIVATGGATSGTAITATGGAPNGIAVSGQGTGNGTGGVFRNAAASTAAGMEGRSQSTAGGGFFTNSSTGPALHVDAGHIKMTGALAGPTATVTDKFVTPANTCRAWAFFQVSGGSLTIQSSYDVTGITPSTTDATLALTGITFPSATSYGIKIYVEEGQFNVSVKAGSRTTTGFVLEVRDFAGTQYNWTAIALKVNVFVFGY